MKIILKKSFTIAENDFNIGQVVSFKMRDYFGEKGSAPKLIREIK